MTDQEKITELENIISEYLKGQNLELVEIIFRREGMGLVLRLLVDRPCGGISMGECAILNSQIGNVLEEKDVIQDRYILEVCSPGLDRPMNRQKDFLRCLNKQAHFFLLELVNNKIELEGVIKEAKEEIVLVETKEGIVEVPYIKLRKAKQIL